MAGKTKTAPRSKKQAPKTASAKIAKQVPKLAKPVVVELAPQRPASPAPSTEQIAAKAYEIWIAKGRPIGQDDLNWVEAEQALSR